MSHEQKFPRYSTTANLQNIPVLSVWEVTSLEQSASRVSIGVLVKSIALRETFPDYDPAREMVAVPNNELLLHVLSSGAYYYVKTIYEHMFPWQSEKPDLHNLTIVGVWTECGDVSRIYTIDNLLADM